MRALIRFISRGPGGAAQQRDRSFDGEAITLGRATDQVLNLKDRRVELEHARIVRTGDRFVISSRALAGVIVNGTACRDAPLMVGDTVQVGSNILQFIAPPAGFDLAFTFELDSTVDTRSAKSVQLALSLAELGLHRRRWAWALCLTILLSFLVVPWLSSPQSGTLLPTRQTILPSDHAWVPGPSRAAHRSFAAKCESCHRRPFVRVEDRACLACHGPTLHRHATQANAQLTSLAATRCASCHHEHVEPSTLARNDAAVCIDCHEKPRRLAGSAATPRASVSDFLRNHPEFGSPTDREASGLKFSHQAHLTAKGIESPSGIEIMKCADCHRPDVAAAHFQPIRMEVHCQRCHLLSFDPRQPERSVPHAKPEQVVQSLFEYFSSAYLQGYPDLLNTARPARSAALPGVDLSAAARAQVLARARQRANIAARDLFERRTCQVCHEIRRVAAGAAPDMTPRWRITPVELPSIWMPDAKFRHAAHATTLTPCSSCHAAEKSQRSADVLMPQIATCRGCHVGTQTAVAERIPSSCTLCHGFHRSMMPLWAPAAPPATRARR